MGSVGGIRNAESSGVIVAGGVFQGPAAVSNPPVIGRSNLEQVAKLQLTAIELGQKPPVWAHTVLIMVQP